MAYLAALIVVVLVTVTLIQGSTVPPTAKAHHHHHHNGTHPTHEPNESDSFNFFYDRSTHKMFVRNGHNCYVAALSDAESTAVHTDIGIKALELKMLAQLSTATLVDASSLNAHELKVCSGHANMYHTIP